MRDRWLIRGAAVLLGGALGLLWPNEGRILLAAALGWLGLGLWRWQPRNFAGNWYRPEFILLSVSLLVGVLVGAGGERLLAPPLTLEEITIEGVVGEWRWLEDGSGRGVIRCSGPGDGQNYGYGKAYVLRVYPTSAAGLPDGWRELRPGNRIRFVGNLEQPEPARSRGAFDLQLYNATHGLAGRITARSEAALLERQDESRSQRESRELSGRLRSASGRRVVLCWRGCSSVTAHSYPRKYSSATR